MLAVIKIYEFYRAVSTRAKLIPLITRDLHFRYIDEGEVLFVNFVLTSGNHASIVTDIRGTLTRTDVSRKTYGLRLLRLGMPVDRGNAFFDHFFVSTSAAEMIPKDEPLRRICLLVVDEYDNKMKVEFGKYQCTVEVLAARVRAALAESADGQDVDLEMQAIHRAFLDAKEAFVREYADAMQLERGKYELKLVWKYHQVGKAQDRIMEEQRSAKFEIAVDAKQAIRASLDRLAEGLFQTSIGKPNAMVLFPELKPVAIEL